MSGLVRRLGATTTIAIVIGGIIGSGIFMKPALMASQLGSPSLLLSVWIVAGCITLFGALSNAEVATMFPETGGQYVFFKKMYGNAFAFLYGWASFAVFNTAGNASIAYVCSEYTNYFLDLPRFDEATEMAVKFHIPLVGDIFPLQNFGVKMLTIVLVGFLSFINYRSVNYSGALQRFLTALKAGAIIILIGGLFISGKGAWSNIFSDPGNKSAGVGTISAYVAALAGAFWAYDGWNNITFIAGEIKDPQRNIPRSLFLGLAFCIVVYFLVNLAFLYVLPVGSMATSSFVASDAAQVAWGSAGGIIIALMIILSTFGTANANIFSTARVTFAMSKENSFFSRAGKIHPRFQTPGNALILNACWSVVLIFSASFDMLTDMLIFVSWFFYGMSALGVFILRVKMKDIQRPYKVWGYPIVPALFVGFVIFFLITTLLGDVSDYQAGTRPVINSLLGILITVAGLPLYYFSSRKTVPNS